MSGKKVTVTETENKEKSYQGKTDFLYSTDADLTYCCCHCAKALSI